LSDVDAVAVTAGPGLIGGLMVGLMTAKAIAMAAAKPLYGINHLEGHALTARLTDNVAFPYLLLLVSGGHTQIVLVEGIDGMSAGARPSTTRSAKPSTRPPSCSASPYPGGPAVEQAALESGEADRFRLPVPMRRDPRLVFSFSGLKTAVRQMAEHQAPLSQQTIADLCLAFQTAVTASLDDRIAMALERFSGPAFPEPVRPPALVVAGGVAANKAISSSLLARTQAAGFRFIAPPLNLCTDNAAMIAWAGAERMACGFAPEPARSGSPVALAAR
jgi:N6-L-threonylcarbamoyladenine synthase